MMYRYTLKLLPHAFPDQLYIYMYVGRPTSRAPKHDGLVPDLGLGEAPNSTPQSRTGVQVSALMIDGEGR